jgi:hypothetical protein
MVMAVTDVLERATAALNRLISTVEDIPIDAMTSPKTIGEWSVKDVLAHITCWEEESAKAFQVWKIGIEPDWSHIGDLDEFNNSSVKERRKQSLGKIIEQLKTVHKGVMDKIKSVPEADMTRRGGIPKWLETQITEHIEEHIDKILAFKSTVQPEPEKAE